MYIKTFFLIESTIKPPTKKCGNKLQKFFFQIVFYSNNNSSNQFLRKCFGVTTMPPQFSSIVVHEIQNLTILIESTKITGNKQTSKVFSLF